MAKLPKLPKINDNELLRERVYSILKQKIIEGEIKGKVKITEIGIARQMGVSKTPVREALKNLNIEGFITLHPNKRMAVTEISAKDIKEVYQLRKILCGLAAELLAKKIEDKDIDKFKKIIKEMELFAKKREVIEYSKTADKFHILMNLLSGNKRLEKLTNLLHEQVYRYRIKSLKVEGRMENSLKEHKNILEALIKKDPKKSSQICKIHIDNAMNNILNDLRLKKK